MSDKPSPDDQLASLLIRTMALLCVRDTLLEDIHAGLTPITRTGDYSDVTVIDADGRRIPGPMSRISTTTRCAISCARSSTASTLSRSARRYRSPGGDGEVQSTLAALYPWGRYEVSERLAVWGVAGYGAGIVAAGRRIRDARPQHCSNRRVVQGGFGLRVTTKPDSPRLRS